MSRIGKSPVVVPKDVQVELTGEEIIIKGKLGELKSSISGDVKVTFRKSDEESDADSDSSSQIIVEPANDSKFSNAMWGTVRSVISNMVKGVSEGFNVRLEINGVGFRASANSKIITLTLGFSHEIKYAIPPEITIKCEKATIIVISGVDKQKVGQVAGELMAFRPVEPYKGKGVYKEGSKIRRKEGKKK